MIASLLAAVVATVLAAMLTPMLATVLTAVLAAVLAGVMTAAAVLSWRGTVVAITVAAGLRAQTTLAGLMAAGVGPVATGGGDGRGRL